MAHASETQWSPGSLASSDRPDELDRQPDENDQNDQRDQPVNRTLRHSVLLLTCSDELTYTEDMAKHEYKVHMQDQKTHRRSFTLVNAKSEGQARAEAHRHHGEGNAHGNRPKTITRVEKTGRTF